MVDADEPWGLRRERAVERLRETLLREDSPRAAMSLAVGLAGVVALCVSAVLLSVGFEAMATRYLVATLAAYGCFLLLVRGWVALYLRGRSHHVDPVDAVDVIDVSDDYALSRSHADHDVDGGQFGGGGAGGSFEMDGDAAPVIVPGSSAVGNATSEGASGLLGSAAEEAWPLFVVVGAVIAAIAGVGFIVWTAPALLAELVLDALILGGVARGLRHVEPEHWTVGIVRRTWIPALSLVVVVTIAGWALDVAAPEASSIGPAVHSLLNHGGS